MDKLITHHYSLDQVNQAFADLEAGKVAAWRVGNGIRGRRSPRGVLLRFHFALPDDAADGDDRGVVVVGGTGGIACGRAFDSPSSRKVRIMGSDATDIVLVVDGVNRVIKARRITTGHLLN